MAEVYLIAEPIGDGAFFSEPSMTVLRELGFQSSEWWGDENERETTCFEARRVLPVEERIAKKLKTSLRRLGVVIRWNGGRYE